MEEAVQNELHIEIQDKKGKQESERLKAENIKKSNDGEKSEKLRNGQKKAMDIAATYPEKAQKALK